MSDVVLKRHCKLLSFFTIISYNVTQFCTRFRHNNLPVD